MKQRFGLSLALFAAGVMLLLPQGAPAQQDTSIHLMLGNPSNATHSPTNQDNYLMVRTQYALSYSNLRLIPNWVSWHLAASDLGPQGRGSFQPDGSLPTNWVRVVPRDYTGSGYDRGHNCPSGDRTATRADNNATFLMSNMMPQAPDNNQGPWERLESYCRAQVQSGNELYITCGSYGTKGVIGQAGVTVPTNTWKVVVVLPNGDNDLSRISEGTRVIAVNMPNRNGIRFNNWRTFRTTVRKIEEVTGYDLLSRLPRSLQDKLETTVDSVNDQDPGH